MQETVPSSKEAAVLEHLGAGWMKLPEISLSRGPVLSWHLDEAVVKAQVVTNGVLP